MNHYEIAAIWIQQQTNLGLHVSPDKLKPFLQTEIVQRAIYNR